MAVMKCIGQVTEQEDRQTSTGKSFHTITVDTDTGELKFSDWKGACKAGGVLGKTGIFVEATFMPGDYPRLLTIKEVEKPASFAQTTVVSAAAKDAQAFMPAAPTFKAGRPSDYATSQEYLAFKLAVDLVKDEQIDVANKIDRLMKAQSAILVAWDKQKGVNDAKV